MRYKEYESNLNFNTCVFIYFLVFIYLVCPKNQPMQSNCNPNFCQLVKCGEGDSCRINPCGTCRPECYDAKGNRATSPRGQLLLFLHYFILFWQSKRRKSCSTIHVIPRLLHWIHPTSYVLTSNTLILCLNWTGVSVRLNTVWIPFNLRRACLGLIIFTSCSPEKRENSKLLCKLLFNSRGGLPCNSDGDARQKFKLNP